MANQREDAPDRDYKVGHFVRVVGGQYDGVYGVLESMRDGEGVVNTRDHNHAKIAVKAEHLVADRSGRR